jgi:hypothetical protein
MLVEAMMKALTVLAAILILLCIDLPTGASSAHAATPRAEHCATSVPMRTGSGLPNWPY